MRTSMTSSGLRGMRAVSLRARQTATPHIPPVARANRVSRRRRVVVWRLIANRIAAHSLDRGSVDPVPAGLVAMPAVGGRSFHAVALTASAIVPPAMMSLA